MADAKITHAARSNGTITHLGNPSWTKNPKWPVQEIIDSLNAGTNTFYTTTKDGKRADVYVVGQKPNQYLRTKGDGVPANNLDNLPSFP